MIYKKVVKRVLRKSSKGFPCGSAGKESACNAGDLGSISELGRSPGEGRGYPFQYSSLENSMDYIVHGIAKNWTRLSDSFSLFKRSNNKENMFYFLSFLFTEEVQIFYFIHKEMDVS